MKRYLSLFLLPLAAQAADTLRADLRTLAPKARTGAPVPAVVTFEWSGIAVLEGRLQVEVAYGNQTLARWESGDLALTTGKQKFQVLLPAWPARNYDRELEAQLRFVTKRGVLRLESQSLFVGAGRERVLVVGVCDPLDTPAMGAARLEPSLRLEASAPSEERALWTTSFARLAPADLPAQPLALAGFDVLYLARGALAQVRDRQRAALLQWVRAGGSLLVVAEDTAPAETAEFLNQLAETPTFPQAVPAAVHEFATGLGRSVVVTRPDEVAGNQVSSRWRQTVGFLWKLRADQCRQIQSTGQWNPIGPRGADEDYRRGTNDEWVGSAVRQLLMPRTIRPIPLSTLAWVLGAFVVVVGPLDYFVLGLLKRRRYTWLLFPLVTVGFTWATIELANHYLGRGDQRRALTVVDVDRAGKVLRENRIELTFMGRDRQVSLPVQAALWSRVTMEREYGYRGSWREDSGDGPVWHRGSLPGRFTVEQTYRQWQPELGRRLTCEAATPVPAINWSATTPGGLLVNLRGPFTAHVFRRGRQQEASTVGSSGVPLPTDLLVALSEFRKGVRLGPRYQMSPTGGATLADVPVMDGSDDRQRVAVVLTAVGDDFVVYRQVSYER